MSKPHTVCTIVRAIQKGYIAGVDYTGSTYMKSQLAAHTCSIRDFIRSHPEVRARTKSPKSPCPPRRSIILFLCQFQI